MNQMLRYYIKAYSIKQKPEYKDSKLLQSTYKANLKKYYSYYNKILKIIDAYDCKETKYCITY